MDLTQAVDELLDVARSRRNFVRGSLATAGALALTETVALGHAFAQSLSDLDILQFALGLEHLEASMYREILAKGVLSGKEQTYFQNFGNAETNHVTTLSQTIKKLGGTPVAAKSAYKFSAFSDRNDILNFAKSVEEIGVGAYQGAATLLKDKNLVAAGGSILQVEARHVAIINLLLGSDPVPAAVTSPLSVQQVTDKVKPISGS